MPSLKFWKKEDQNRYLPVPREHYLRLGLATPPENGYDDFLKLVWCRDTKDEKRQAKEAEKKKVKDFQVVCKYFLCIVGIYEPYRANDPPINLNKKGYKPLPKWSHEDYMEEILRNGYFFRNDAFILEHYKQAIKPAEDYPYVEQYVPAFQHWNEGQKPSKEQIQQHKINVVVTIMEALEKLESVEEDPDEEQIQKLKDIITSMDLEEEEHQECEKRLGERKAGTKKT